MKSLWRDKKEQAFTLVEMLVVIAIIAVLAALLLPALTRGKQRAQRIQCIGNLKEMGTAFQMFAHDHQGKFPMQVPQAEGGSQEFVTAASYIPGPFYFSFRHFQALANELVVPRILVCPADLERQPALSFGALQNSNVSYFVSVGADYNTPSSVLAGDRNITSDADETGSLLYGGRGFSWTRELHFYKGNILFSDSHVEQMNTPHIEFAAGTGPGTVISMPTVTPPSSSAGPGSGPNPGSGSGPGSGPGSGSGPSPSSGPVNAGSPSGGNDSSGQSVAQRTTKPGITNSPEPGQQPFMPANNGMASSQIPGHQSGSHTSILEAHAREKNGEAAIRAPAPTAAPAAKDGDDVAPTLRLLGAARVYVSTSPWWLWLLLALLLAGAAYLYSTRKKNRSRKR
jgi:prepilin-type N-terminal cleavage/methylation domain-containing protein